VVSNLYGITDNNANAEKMLTVEAKWSTTHLSMFEILQ
jgi:hypothetical protein